jgi:hypothetical protein
MFAPRYFPRSYFAGNYWAPNEFDPNNIAATLEGVGFLTGTLTPNELESLTVSGRSVQMLFRADGMSFSTRVHRRTN